MLWIAFALGIAAVMLSGLYREHVEREHAERIGGYLRARRPLDVAPDGSLQLQRDPVRTRCSAAPFSGLYWEVIVDGEPLLRSRSLWGPSVAGRTVIPVAGGGPAGRLMRTVRHPTTHAPAAGRSRPTAVVAMAALVHARWRSRWRCSRSG